MLLFYTANLHNKAQAPEPRESLTREPSQPCISNSFQNCAVTTKSDPGVMFAPQGIHALGLSPQQLQITAHQSAGHWCRAVPMTIDEFFSQAPHCRLQARILLCFRVTPGQLQTGAALLTGRVKAAGGGVGTLLQALCAGLLHQLLPLPHCPFSIPSPRESSATLHTPTVQ